MEETDKVENQDTQEVVKQDTERVRRKWEKKDIKEKEEPKPKVIEEIDDSLKSEGTSKEDPGSIKNQQSPALSRKQSNNDIKENLKEAKDLSAAFIQKFLRIVRKKKAESSKEVAVEGEVDQSKNDEKP